MNSDKYDSSVAKKIYYIYRKIVGDTYYCENPDCPDHKKEVSLRSLELAHRIPRRISPSLKYDPNNMILFCIKCHAIWENQSERIIPNTKRQSEIYQSDILTLQKKEKLSKSLTTLKTKVMKEQQLLKKITESQAVEKIKQKIEATEALRDKIRQKIVATETLKDKIHDREYTSKCIVCKVDLDTKILNLVLLENTPYCINCFRTESKRSKLDEKVMKLLQMYEGDIQYFQNILYLEFRKITQKIMINDRNWERTQKDLSLVKRSVLESMNKKINIKIMKKGIDRLLKINLLPKIDHLKEGIPIYKETEIDKLYHQFLQSPTVFNRKVEELYLSKYVIQSIRDLLLEEIQELREKYKILKARIKKNTNKDAEIQRILDKRQALRSQVSKLKAELDRLNKLRESDTIIKKV
jgi:hypothetical protein